MTNTRRKKRTSKKSIQRGSGPNNVKKLKGPDNEIPVMKHSLENAYRNSTDLGTLSPDDLKYIEELRDQVKGMGVSGIQTYILNNNLLDLEVSGEYNEYGPSPEETRNNMKVGWLVNLLHIHSDEFIEANNSK